MPRNSRGFETDDLRIQSAEEIRISRIVAPFAWFSPGLYSCAVTILRNKVNLSTIEEQRST